MHSFQIAPSIMTGKLLSGSINRLRRFFPPCRFLMHSLFSRYLLLFIIIIIISSILCFACFPFSHLYALALRVCVCVYFVISFGNKQTVRAAFSIGSDKTANSATRSDWSRASKRSGFRSHRREFNVTQYASVVSVADRDYHFPRSLFSLVSILWH